MFHYYRQVLQLLFLYNSTSIESLLCLRNAILLFVQDHTSLDILMTFFACVTQLYYAELVSRYSTRFAISVTNSQSVLQIVTYEVSYYINCNLFANFHSVVITNSYLKVAFRFCLF